ncbi:MAG: peroxiredoxin [Sulfobacillus sp.]
MFHDPSRLPEGLPVPQDDGACRHLAGSVLPPIALDATGGGTIDLSALVGRSVVYVYPRTGQPGQPLPTGWDAIAGARGCTPESLGFAAAFAQFTQANVRVFGLSSQERSYQEEAVSRLKLPFQLLSDHQLRLARALRLPLFEVDQMILMRRLTLVIRDGIVEHVFYPVFPPDSHALSVLQWLQDQP